MTLVNLNAFGVAGTHVQIYLLTVDHGWFQVYIIQTHILQICDVEKEGNSVVTVCVLAFTQQPQKSLKDSSSSPVHSP
jgi:hypothetical protein